MIIAAAAEAVCHTLWNVDSRTLWLRDDISDKNIDKKQHLPDYAHRRGTSTSERAVHGTRASFNGFLDSILDLIEISVRSILRLHRGAFSQCFKVGR